MFVTREAAVAIVFTIASIFWCSELLKRLPEDFKSLVDEGDLCRKAATVIVWLLTAPLLLLTARALAPVMRGVMEFFR